MSFSSTPSEGGCSRLRARFAIDGQALDAISPLTAVVRPAYGRLAKHQGINQASSHEPVTAHGWQRVLVPSSIRLSTLHVVLLQSMGWDGGHHRMSLSSLTPGMAYAISTGPMTF